MLIEYTVYSTIRNPSVKELADKFPKYKTPSWMLTVTVGDLSIDHPSWNFKESNPLTLSPTLTTFPLMSVGYLISFSMCNYFFSGNPVALKQTVSPIWNLLLVV